MVQGAGSPDPEAWSLEPEALYGIDRYLSGTSVKPQSFNCRAHVPRFSFVTRTRSIGMIWGTSFFKCTLSTIFSTDTFPQRYVGCARSTGASPFSTYGSSAGNASTATILTLFGSMSVSSDGVNSGQPPIIAQPWICGYAFCTRMTSAAASCGVSM